MNELRQTVTFGEISTLIEERSGEVLINPDAQNKHLNYVNTCSALFNKYLRFYRLTLNHHIKLFSSVNK